MTFSGEDEILTENFTRVWKLPEITAVVELVVAAAAAAIGLSRWAATVSSFITTQLDYIADVAAPRSEDSKVIIHCNYF